MKSIGENQSSAVDFFKVFEDVYERLKHSLREHGDWEDYDEAKVFEKVSDEFDEYREAFVANQVDGRHGQIDELLDVAVTAIKGIRRLSK